MSAEVLPTPYFLARPKTRPRAGVVVIHEGNGMGWQLLRVGERLAAEGYLVVAPDVFHRRAAGHGDWQEAFSTLRKEEFLEDLAQAMAVLREAGAGKIGITGFCMGGRLSYLAAISGVGLSASVPFYGAGIDRFLGQPSCPLLAIFGGRDPYVPGESMEKIRARHGGDVIVYPEAGHGFMRDGSDDYHPESARDAWRRLLDFFAVHLK